MKRFAALLAVMVMAQACQAAAPPSPTATSAPSPTLVSAPPRATTAQTPTIEPTTARPSQTPAPTTVPTPSDPRTAGWAADLTELIDFREQMHPNPWFGIDRDDYVAEVESTISRIPELNDDQLLVEATRLAAMPTWAGRDGHGGIYPWGEGSYGGHSYPLRMYWFSDGLFVVDAMAPYESTIGSQVEAINGHSVDDVLAAVEPLIPRDNQQQVLSESPRLMTVSEVLHGVGILDESNVATAFTLTADGATTDVAIEPVDVGTFESWSGGHHTLSPPARPDGPLWLSNIDDTIWWQIVPGTRTAYVGYNLVDSNSLIVASDLSIAMDAGEFDTLVVDLRHNPGGNNTTYGALLSVVQRADEELPGGVYLAISRATFSAAGNFSTDVEQSTDAVFVGEDLGASPNLYGDSQSTELAYAGLRFRVALRYWEKSTPDDPRITIEPDIEAPLSSTDYFGDRDPVMEAIEAAIR